LLRNISSSNGRIALKFRELRARGEGALIAYLTGGDPDPDSFLANAGALVEGGADIIEVGIPFSDPIADGPVIQASSQRTLANGVTPRKVLGLVSKVSKAHDVPIVLLSYYNPIMAAGEHSFMELAEQSGVNGVVIPDLSVEESDPLCEAARRHHIDTIFLGAPNTPPSRLKMLLDKSQGFFYLVSLFGVTGPRKELSPDASNLVKRVKSIAKDEIPVALGFGVSLPKHVSDLISSGADGAIIGSALVEIVTRNLESPEKASIQLRETVSELKRATRALE